MAPLTTLPRYTAGKYSPAVLGVCELVVLIGAPGVRAAPPKLEAARRDGASVSTTADEWCCLPGDCKLAGVVDDRPHGV